MFYKIEMLGKLNLYKFDSFSLTLLFILGTHEFGHYYFAQKHNVDATLPYFIPAPPFIFLIGTLLLKFCQDAAINSQLLVLTFDTVFRNYRGVSC